MKIPQNYSHEQWKLISSLPHLTVLLFSFVFFEDIDNSSNKLQSGVKALAMGRMKYNDNPIVCEIIPDGDTFEKVFRKMQKEQQELLSKKLFYSEKSLEEFQKNVLNEYKTVVYHLTLSETSLTFIQYINWILYIAESVIITSINETAIPDSPFKDKERELFNKIKRSFVSGIFS